MIQTGKYYESIVELLNNFRTEVGIFSSLGLLNINKHSENFMKRVLNLTYGYELENLNKEKSNFPGIDLGDTGESIAFQITATKKSDKIDDTLSACLKYKHYDTFKTINVFVLTAKQGSYTLKVDTEPHFTFSSDKNILDFSDLIRDIEHIEPMRMKALYDYIKSELNPTIEAIRNDKADDKKQLLDIHNALQKSNMPNFLNWRSKVSIKNSNFSVPEIHTKLNDFLSTPALKTQLLPILNSAFRKSNSTKEMLYQDEMHATGVSNLFYGQAMLIENSSLTTERHIYSNDIILTNLLPEMLMLLTEILFFSKHSHTKFEIDVSISMEANIKTHFHPNNSLVIDHVFNSYILESPFELQETLTDTNTSTLVNLLQKIMHGFISKESNLISDQPFLTIDRAKTEQIIDKIKDNLGIKLYHIM